MFDEEHTNMYNNDTLNVVKQCFVTLDVDLYLENYFIIQISLIIITINRK